jgi:hypothetical protein
MTEKDFIPGKTYKVIRKDAEPLIITYLGRDDHGMSVEIGRLSYDAYSLPPYLSIEETTPPAL